jgi:hypothetical protein
VNPVDYDEWGRRGRDEIRQEGLAGGANTSHTIVVAALRALLNAVPACAPEGDYEKAVMEANVLGKRTEGARRRTFRYLRELYLLRPDAILFRALRDLWADDQRGQPLLAGLCALARDPVFRASSAAITDSSPGACLTSGDMARAVGAHFPDNYGSNTLAKIGRNTFSSWEQTGHLAVGDRPSKARARAACFPSNVTYALLLGYLEGLRGEGLFATSWTRVLDHPRSHLLELAINASQRGLMEFRQAGGIVEVTFHELLRPFVTAHP